MLDWIESYLTDRVQNINIGDSYSNTANMNDMHQCTELDMVHCANDSTAYVIDDSLESWVPLINLELEKLCQ